MSIRNIQIQRVFEDVVHHFYSTGKKPEMNDVLNRISAYFSKYPAGNPLPLYEEENLAGGPQVSDVKKFNQTLAHLSLDLDVLYEASLEQVQQVMGLTSALQSYLDRLTLKRRALETRIDDYLLSQYNTDGYFYSLTDTFSNTSNTDLTLTSAYIDTSAGMVVIPSNSSLTTKVPKGSIGSPSILASANGVRATVRSLAPFLGAIEDSLTNIIWGIEVETETPSDVIVFLTIPLFGRPSVSRVDFDPYGFTPVQIFMESALTGGEESYVEFGGKITTGSNLMIFTDSSREMDSLRISLRKTSHDYTDDASGVTKYRYIFGAKSLVLTQQVYDVSARFVSQNLAMSAELAPDMTIDAVSLLVDQVIPNDTSIKYYVAAIYEGDATVTDITSLSWRAVEPSGSGDGTAMSNVIRFDGAKRFRRKIHSDATGSDLFLIPLDDTSLDFSQRNPSPAIVEGVDIYRIAELKDTFLLNSIKLEEGVNTVRARYIPMNTAAVDGLGFWTTVLQDPDTSVAFGKIDAGNDFFYGGDIGQGNISVLVETYLESDTNQETFLAEFQKSDTFSQTWSVRVYLNGRELGYLPVGTHRVSLPWTFRQGKNYICMLVNIPANKSTGTINLLGDDQLYQYGRVKLADWSYVDFFDTKYNETAQPFTFTVKDNTIISRRKPATTFEVTYQQEVQGSPVAVRFRADLARGINSPNLSAQLRSYTLRFLYGEQ